MNALKNPEIVEAVELQSRMAVHGGVGHPLHVQHERNDRLFADDMRTQHGMIGQADPPFECTNQLRTRVCGRCGRCGFNGLNRLRENHDLRRPIARGEFAQQRLAAFGQRNQAQAFFLE